MSPVSAKKAAAPKKTLAVAAPPEGEAKLIGWRSRVVGRSLEQATQRSIDRGGSFIDAAMKLLQRSESAGFTVQQVADLAGQSLRTFYQHFASKNDLLLAVFEEEVRTAAVSLRKAVDNYTDPVERIAAFMIAGASAPIGAHPESAALTQYRIELAVSRPNDLALVQAPVVGLARELVAAAVAANAIPRCDPDSAAYILVTLKSSVLHSKILGNELGVSIPDPINLARFCIEGLNATFPQSLAHVDPSELVSRRNGVTPRRKRDLQGG